jgi:hypothetical protein
MQLHNETPLSAHMFRGVVDDETMLAIVACRMSCLISDDGRLTLQDIQDPVRVQPVESPLGLLEDDAAPVKPLVDVVVLGEAFAPRGKPVREMIVALRVGDRLCQLRVIGDRTWQAVINGAELARAVERSRADQHDLEALAPTPATPFRSLPICWKRAFGGSAKVPDGEVPWSYNPQGIGYHHLLEHALGAPLPNLEAPMRPMAHWRDWVDAACFAPLPRTFRDRTERGLKIDADSLSLEVLPEYFLVAPRGQTFAPLEAGTAIEVVGMHTDGAIHFEVPDLPAELSVSVGDDHLVVPSRLDTVEIWPSERRVSFVLRASVRYRFRRRETRTATLRQRSA